MRNFEKFGYIFRNVFLFSGKIPVSILEDPLWDVKSFPTLDPKMKNHMNADRKIRLTNQQYIQQRIFNINPRYANCLSWVYAATGFLEMKQMTSNINISMQRGVKSTREDGKTEYKLESAYTVLENIKNTPKYWSTPKGNWKKERRQGGVNFSIFTRVSGQISNIFLGVWHKLHNDRTYAIWKLFWRL